MGAATSLSGEENRRASRPAHVCADETAPVARLRLADDASPFFKLVFDNSEQDGDRLTLRRGHQIFFLGQLANLSRPISQFTCAQELHPPDPFLACSPLATIS
jgi:hypothetical protein